MGELLVVIEPAGPGAVTGRLPQEAGAIDEEPKYDGSWNISWKADKVKESSVKLSNYALYIISRFTDQPKKIF